MHRLRVTRAIELPDELRLARYRRMPELGPRVLFFTGGTALRKLSRTIKLYSHNTVHLITPFDSGGSSAKLRIAFRMLSVGDLRNRLIALADESVRGNPEIYRLFVHRLDEHSTQQELLVQIEQMAEGSHPLIAAIPVPMRHLVRSHVKSFYERMPADFDLRGASIGNLVLVGGFLGYDRDIDAVIFWFSTLVAVRGTVCPIVDADLHLEAELADGSRIVGQHRITGKEQAPLTTPIRDLRLVKALDDRRRARVEITDKIRGYIRDAELICFPMGSFWSSVVANLLPAGVGAAIEASDNPKVFIPNAGDDPEMLGMSVHDCVEVLQRKVSEDVGSTVPMERVVNFVVVDSRGADYGNRLDKARLSDLGIEVIDVPLVTARSRPVFDAVPVAEVLLSLS